MAKQSILAKILGLPEGTKVNFNFSPLDNSIAKVSWNSPNDNRANLINMLLNPQEVTTVKIKDNH